MKKIERAIAAKIEKLQKYIQDLEKFRKKFSDREKFIKTPEQNYAVAKVVEFCSEAIKDISLALFKRENIKREKFTSLREALEELTKKGILSKDFPQLIEDWVRFRNALVHGYVSYDPGALFDHAKQNTHLFKKFLKEVVNYLDTH